jgi:predicted nucleic acid-binding Zn ribbon protein
MEGSEEHTGSMVMRAWLEGGRPDQLRVRIFFAIGSRQAPPTAASSVTAVHEAVDDWLTQLRSRPDDVPVTPH